MKKILFTLMVVACACAVSAQDFDLETIAKARKVKADSLAVMMGKVYASQAAMNHPTSEARAILLKAFDETVNLDKQDEEFKEGNNIATEILRQAQGMKERQGIEMSRKLYAQAAVDRFNDTTSTKSVNDEMRAINEEARHLINAIAELKKDSVGNNAQAISLKSDSLSLNLGRFFGLQMRAVSQQKGRNEAQMARVLEGFNNGINIDDTNKPLVDGRMMGTEFVGGQENMKKQFGLTVDKEIFCNTVKNILADPAVPTLDEFNAISAQTSAYYKEVVDFAKENSAEALAQKGLGKKYIENLMEKESGYIQTPSGLVYKMLEPGKGKQFEVNDKIKVMYKGTHVDGKTFDESKEPVSFAPNQVVPGFREALLMMRPGAKMIAVLPQDLAYGARGAGQAIKPFETLIFEIETIGLDETANADKAKAATQKPAAAVKGVKNVKAKSADVEIEKTQKDSKSPVTKGKKAKTKTTGKAKLSKKKK